MTSISLHDDGQHECKKQKIDSTPVDNNVECSSNVFIIPDRIQKARLKILLSRAREKGFNVADNYRSDITHIVTEYDSVGLVKKALKLPLNTTITAHMVKVDWLTDCLKASRVLPVLTEHIAAYDSATMTTSSQPNKPTIDKAVLNQVKVGFACERSNPLVHPNKKFTDALLMLAEYAELRGSAALRDSMRVLAFEKAAATLKCLPRQITADDNLKSFKDIGEHSINVIQDILQTGRSKEVDERRAEDWYQTVKLFASIYGVGPATAKKWWDLEHRTLQDVVTHPSFDIKDRRILLGLAFLDDLDGISREEADQVVEKVSVAAQKCLPGVKWELTGGFRRGKPRGHDVDILMSHPEEGREVGLLSKVHSELDRGGFWVHTVRQAGDKMPNMMSHGAVDNTSDGTTLDEFEKSLNIIRLPLGSSECRGIRSQRLSHTHTKPCLDALDAMERDGKELTEAQTVLLGFLRESCAVERAWIAVRVDLVVVPDSQWSYALVGWTGNKNFNRSVRLYAKRRLHMKLTSHWLYDHTAGKFLPADTEEEVFDHLKLTYRSPHDRNA